MAENFIRIDSFPTGFGEYLERCRLGVHTLRLLVWKDLRLRYRNAWVAVLSALVQPLAGGACLSWVLQHFQRKQGTSDAAFLDTFCGFLVFQLLARALFRGSQSLRENQQLAARVYFPRIFLPLGAALSGLLEFVMGCVLCALLRLAFYGAFDWSHLWVIPPLILMLAVGASSVAGFGAIVDAYIQDFRFVIPFLVQVLLFLSPVFFLTSSASGPFLWFLHFHPLSGATELLRYALTGHPFPSVALLSCSFGVGLLLLCFELLMFQRKEYALNEQI